MIVPLALVLRGEGLGVRGSFGLGFSPSPPTPLPLSTGGEGSICYKTRLSINRVVPIVTARARIAPDCTLSGTANVSPETTAA